MYVVDINMKKNDRNLAGFSLIEMLLVLAIISSILMAVMGYTIQKSSEMRRDRMVLQVQQIENAGLAFYVNTSSWPSTLADLQTNGFLPAITIKNSYGNDYVVSNDATKGTFSVCTAVAGTAQSAPADAAVIAGRLPMGFVANGTPPASGPCPAVQSACNSASCTVVSLVNIPGQNLNNARSVNFAGLYKNGGCVPVPNCPDPTMTPAIYAIPVSIKGALDGSTANTVFPITGFTAYAKGGASSGTSPPACNAAGTPTACAVGSGSMPSVQGFWRVCAQITTSEGQLNNGNTQDAANIVAITRCVPRDEAPGSGFDVFTGPYGGN